MHHRAARRSIRPSLARSPPLLPVARPVSRNVSVSSARADRSTPEQAARRVRLFNERLTREPRALWLVKRTIVIVVGVHACLALVSGYRAIVQIYRVRIDAPARPLAAGATVHVSVVTSGRTYAHVRLELVQEGRATLLGLRDVPRNRDGAYDPLPQRASLDVVLSAGQLSHVRPGSAVLRATAVGARQWLRVPPPTVREAPVVIAP